jgi:hypothetical protein
VRSSLWWRTSQNPQPEKRKLEPLNRRHQFLKQRNHIVFIISSMKASAQLPCEICSLSC